jgi:competence protein ComEA
MKRLILLLLWYCCYNVASAININLASIEDLEKVQGITHKKAVLIVSHRRKYGFYNNIDELVRIKGISVKWVLNIQTKLTV